MTSPAHRLTVGASDPDLNQRISGELSAFNVDATGEDNERSMSVRAVDETSELAGGLMGWTWGTCAGIEMLWVRADQRGRGLGRAIMSTAEQEARRRGCSQNPRQLVYVSGAGFLSDPRLRRIRAQREPPDRRPGRCPLPQGSLTSIRRSRFSLFVSVYPQVGRAGR